MVTMVATKISQQCFKYVKLFINKMFTLYNVCSVNWGIFSTSGDVQYIRGYHYECGGDTMCTLGDVQYIGEIPLVHWRGGISRVHGGGRDIMSTLGDVQHIRGIS